MQTIKFLPNNQILLNNNTLLTKVPYTKYYIEKSYQSYNKFYTINNNTYV